MKLRGHYEKPSERRVREKAAAIRLARKLARKKLQARICCRDEASGGSGGPRKSRPSAHSSLLIFEHPVSTRSSGATSLTAVSRAPSDEEAHPQQQEYNLLEGRLRVRPEF
jgi:hypothetical protein